jgi:pimeloyl-ACP methyl ester carboxylesterase
MRWHRELLGLMLGLTACGSESGTASVEEQVEAQKDGGAAGSPVSFALGVPCEDAPHSLYGDPGRLPSEQGAIIRCVDDGIIDKDTLERRIKGVVSESTYVDEDGNQEVVRNTYEGPLPETGTHVYRVLYRTERGDGRPGYSVATMYVPEADVRARMPLLLMARGSRGQAPACAPSLWTEGKVVTTDSPDGRYVQNDVDSMLLPLVASGFVVAMTDSAGFANYGAKDNPPSVYADIQDMGKSLLDSGHALRQLLPNGTTDDVLLIGLSQGGHTVLGSLQVANTYRTPGSIIGAAVYSPLWFAQRAWGVVMSPVAPLVGVVLNKSSGVPVSFWYHYSQAEMYDGPGEGIELFKPELRGAIQDFVDATCWSVRYQELEDATRRDAPASDFFTEELVAAVGASALTRSCDDSSDKAVCEKWLARYRDDHPVLTGAAARVPLLVAYGLKDVVIPPARFKCAVDKLRMSNQPIDYCLDDGANHSGIIMRQSQYVNQWLMNKALGTPIGITCPITEVPSSLECDGNIPND